MLSLPPDMQAALDRGVTTHCWCWRVVRRDGAVFGFTDHDRDLEIEDLVYRPGGGFAPGDRETRTGLAPAQGEASGAADAVVLTAPEIETGTWSAATVETWRLDWVRPELRVMVCVAEIGEVRRRGGRFEAELLGRAHRLETITGRVFSRQCDAALGDARCGVPAGHPELSAGCDGAFATCRERFANTLNFRGFPYMTGNDVLQASPASEAIRDGGSRGTGA